MLRFGVAKLQYVLLLTSAQKIAPKLDLNSVPLLVSPEPYPVSYGKVLSGLPMLLLTKPKIDRNSKTKMKSTIPCINLLISPFPTCTCKNYNPTTFQDLREFFFVGGGGSLSEPRKNGMRMCEFCLYVLLLLLLLWYVRTSPASYAVYSGRMHRVDNRQCSV